MPLPLQPAFRVCAFAIFSLLTSTSLHAADPYASNNGQYPVGQWTGPYRTLNFDYPGKTLANG
jgi:hypothetical protein